MVERETIRFTDRLGPQNGSGERHTVRRDATVESVRVRHYPGQELALEVEPRVVPRDERDSVPLVPVEGPTSALVGDDDDVTFDVSEPVREGEAVEVVAVNESTEFSYDFVVDVTLEYIGGSSSFLAGVLS